jgi:signal transduction histidine kinase
MNRKILAVDVRSEPGVVLARQRARQIAGLLEFATLEQTRIATAVSELARNAVEYAGSCRVEFALEDGEPPECLVVRISDEGPGIPHLSRILDGRYLSKTGLGLGLIGAKRLMDRFEVDSAPGEGTRIVLGKALPRTARKLEPEQLAKLVDELLRRPPHVLSDELRRQNQELIETMAVLQSQREELIELNRELEDTNRGVVALYAELDDKAESLRRVSDIKTRFLSNMTHEFRTPLNSILNLTRLLLERLDGELTPEQEKQVGFIRKAAEGLSELVNDLLDIAKVEAGKSTVRPAEIHVEDLFGALRGMIRPLQSSHPGVTLLFEEAQDLPVLYTDEAKISQILRNLASNALKYTEAGEVRVWAERLGDAEIRFSIADKGIGIAPEDQERIFEEYTQLDTPLHRRVKGTGLGLPLSRRLAGLLGGRIELHSELGKGSTFSLVLPLRYSGKVLAPAGQEVHRE